MSEETTELLPSSTTNNSNILRRSNSVPLISGLGCCHL
ncbi:PREDICTED: protein FAM122C [Chrysochloris asiatica]|uniref:Protein FAM122C n=1 Tax=Chrysochloris asiatica TaxID=185453 RepID=A0A9B0TED5_CHRAS|nr:PREDICTED: protein FAM122C [Chrysochloris asiatica]